MDFKKATERNTFPKEVLLTKPLLCQNILHCITLKLKQWRERLSHFHVIIITSMSQFTEMTIRQVSKAFTSTLIQQSPVYSWLWNWTSFQSNDHTHQVPQGYQPKIVVKRMKNNIVYNNRSFCISAGIHMFSYNFKLCLHVVWLCP